VDRRTDASGVDPRRAAHRDASPRDEELWHGNKEAPLHTVFTDPEHIVRWAWRTRHLLRELIPAVEATHPHLVIVRLHTSSEVDRFVTRSRQG
jgi:hypothetical protein